MVCLLNLLTKHVLSCGPSAQTLTPPPAAPPLLPPAPDFGALQSLVDELVEGIEREGAVAVKDVGKIFHFNLITDGKPTLNFALNLKDGNGSVEFDPPDSLVSDAKLSMTMEKFISLADGSLNGMSAFINGDLTIKGDLMSVMKLEGALKKFRRPTAPGLPAAPTPPVAALDPLQQLLDQIMEGIRREGPVVVKEIGAIYQFKLIADGKPNLKFALNLKDGSGAVELNPPDSLAANAKITMKMDKFISLADGSLDGMSAFLNGHMTIRGDIMSAIKLEGAMKKFRK